MPPPPPRSPTCHCVALGSTKARTVEWHVQEGESAMEAVVTRVLLGNPDEALDMLRVAERQGTAG